MELFTQKVVIKLSKIWVWDPGSRGQKGPNPGSRIRIRNTATNTLDPKSMNIWYGSGRSTDQLALFSGMDVSFSGLLSYIEERAEKLLNSGEYNKAASS
jgi:hypothetical protein